MSGGYPDHVSALAVVGTDLYAGGYFTTPDGTAAKSIAKWNGNAWSALGAGIDGEVLALAVMGTDLYAAGWFPTAGGTEVNHIAKWNGSTWSALGAEISTNTICVYALAVSGTDLYAGGGFTSAGGTAANYIAKWDGSAWSALGSGMNSEVYALAVAGTDLYAGGYFSTAGNKVSGYAARANIGASSEPSLNIARSNAFVIVSWPATGVSFQLQETTNLSLPNSWVPVGQSAVTNAGHISVTVPASVGSKLFRLRSP
jgi:hypothetical protein